MSSTHTILCGNCGTAVEGPEDPKPDDNISCAKCGQTDTYAQVLESAKEYATDRFAESMNSTLADAVRGSKVVKFTPSKVPSRGYRWTVADFNL